MKHWYSVFTSLHDTQTIVARVELDLNREGFPPKYIMVNAKRAVRHKRRDYADKYIYVLEGKIGIYAA